jgi:hypothetical protein
MLFGKVMPYSLVVSNILEESAACSFRVREVAGTDNLLDQLMKLLSMFVK